MATDYRRFLNPEVVSKLKSLASAGAEATVFQDPGGRFVAFAPAGSRLLVGIGDSAPAALNRAR